MRRAVAYLDLPTLSTLFGLGPSAIKDCRWLIDRQALGIVIQDDSFQDVPRRCGLPEVDWQLETVAMADGSSWHKLKVEPEPVEKS